MWGWLLVVGSVSKTEFRGFDSLTPRPAFFDRGEIIEVGWLAVKQSSRVDSGVALRGEHVTFDSSPAHWNRAGCPGRREILRAASCKGDSEVPAPELCSGKAGAVPLYQEGEDVATEVRSVKCERCRLTFDTPLKAGVGGGSNCPRCNWPGESTLPAKSGTAR